MKSLLTLFTLTIFLAGCGKTEVPSSVNAADKILVKSEQNFDVCDGQSCLSASTALRDLYSSNDMPGNFGLIPSVGIFTIVNSVKYLDGKDTYAIFFTQLNRFSQGTIDTCHACGALLGVAVYQKHNDWKLFAKVNNLVDMGSWGKVFGYQDEKSLSIHSGGPEKFVIAINGGFMAQGYTKGWVDLIGISPNGTNQYLPPIRYLGSIGTSSSDCGTGNERGDDWRGVPTFDWRENPPLVAVNKVFRKGCADEVVEGSKVTLKYKFDGKAYIETK